MFIQYIYSNPLGQTQKEIRKSLLHYSLLPDPYPGALLPQQTTWTARTSPGDISYKYKSSCNIPLNTYCHQSSCHKVHHVTISSEGQLSKLTLTTNNRSRPVLWTQQWTDAQLTWYMSIL